MIKGYAFINDYGRSVRVNIGHHKIWGNQQSFQPYIFDSNTACARLGDEELVPEHVQPSGGLDIPTDVAEELWRALDRLFGKKDDTPTVVRDALAKEQARVDKALDALIGYLDR